MDFEFFHQSAKKSSQNTSLFLKIFHFVSPTKDNVLRYEIDGISAGCYVMRLWCAATRFHFHAQLANLQLDLKNIANYWPKMETFVFCNYTFYTPRSQKLGDDRVKMFQGGHGHWWLVNVKGCLLGINKLRWQARGRGVTQISTILKTYVYPSSY